MDKDTIEILIFGLLGSFPLLLVWLAGAVFCVIYARRMPVACTLTGVALAIALVTRVTLPFISTWFFQGFLTNMDQLRWRVALQYFVFSIPSAIVYGLLLWAIFGSASLMRRVGPGFPFPEEDFSNPIDSNTKQG